MKESEGIYRVYMKEVGFLLVASIDLTSTGTVD